MNQRDQAVVDYYWVKENIRYSLAPWGGVSETLATRRGHCGHKTELLSALLREKGIKTRYIEGRNSVSNFGVVSPLGRHIWLEAEVDGEWLTLDPALDSGIAHSFGDTEPGTHLGNYAREVVWDELPIEYKQIYNNPLVGLVRLYYEAKILLERRMPR